MGAGKGRTITKEIVEAPLPNGKYVDVDLDIDSVLNSSSKYLEEASNFNMSRDEVQDFMNRQGIQLTYDFTMIDSINPDGTVNIVDDPSILFSMYSSMQTLLTVEKAYQKATGTDTRLVDNLSFKTSESDSDLGSVSTSGYHTFQYGKSSMVLNIDTGVTISDIRTYKSTEKFSDKMVREMSNSQSGWFAHSGSYLKTTMAHELGHAVYANLNKVLNVRVPSLDKVGSVGRLRSIEFEAKQLHAPKLYKSPVSGYSQANPHEAFAECFSLYVYGGKSKSTMYVGFQELMKNAGLESMYGILK